MSRYLPSSNPVVLQIEESLKLTRNLFVSSLLYGEPHSGKRSLVHRLFPNTPRADGRRPQELRQLLEREKELVIEHFEAIEELESIELEDRRIIAIANRANADERLDGLFAFSYRMPPLRERPEDLEAMSAYFAAKAQEELMLTRPIEADPQRLDLSGNFRSLRASIYREGLLYDLRSDEIEVALERLFEHALEGNNAYRQNLGILERPLLKAGLRRYGSQLKLAAVLGINRNTLRKKLHEYRID